MTHTDADPTGLCSQCGEPFGEHSCVPIPSCIHFGPIPAEVEAAARSNHAFQHGARGSHPDWERLHENIRDAYREEARASLEAAWEVRNAAH